MKKITLIIFASFLILSCTDAKRAKLGGLGNEFKIEVYSGGIKVKEYISTGKVSTEKDSDGYYFLEKSTGKLIEVAGDIIITEL